MKGFPNILIKIFLRGLILLVIVFVILVAAGHWQFHVMSQGHLVTMGTHKMDFSFTESGHLIVEVLINGKPCRLMVDSGASNMIFSHRKDRVRLGGYMGPGFGIGGNGGGFLTSMFGVNHLSVGGHEFEKLTFKVLDFKLGCGEDIDGILGKETMRHLSWYVDPSQMEIILSDQMEALPGLHGDTLSLAVNKYGYQLHTPGSVNGIKTWFVVDTGSNGFLSLGKDLQVDKKVRILGIGSRALDGPSTDSLDWIFSDSVKFSKVIPPSAVQVMIGNGQGSTMGIRFLRNYKFILDWKERILILEALPDQSFVSYSFGVGLRFDDVTQKLRVTSFLENSVLDNASISPGAVVECLNNHCDLNRNTYCAMQLNEVENLVLKLEGVDSTFTISRFHYDDLVRLN